MKHTFITRYYQAGAGLAALGAAGPVGLGLAGAQTALGIVQAITGDAKMKKLLAQRRAYVTPDEIYDILNATASRASSGYDPTTLNYLTNQTDRAFSSSIEAATLLGADPNQLSNIFDQKMQATMKIGAENQLLNLKNFERYLQAESVVAENKAAEQKSQQDIIKDKLQAAGLNKQAGLQNIGSGVNAALSTVSALGTANLYKDSMTAEPFVNTLQNITTPAERISSALPALKNTIGGRTSPDVMTIEELIQLLKGVKLPIAQ